MFTEKGLRDEPPDSIPITARQKSNVLLNILLNILLSILHVMLTWVM